MGQRRLARAEEKKRSAERAKMGKHVVGRRYLWHRRAPSSMALPTPRNPYRRRDLPLRTAQAPIPLLDQDHPNLFQRFTLYHTDGPPPQDHQCQGITRNLHYQTIIGAYRRCPEINKHELKLRDKFIRPLLQKMLSLERIPDQTGYLILTEDGAVLTSGGELENDERIANIVMGLVTLTGKVDVKAFPNNEAFDKISITYQDHCYIICLSNKKIHIVKKKLASSSATVMDQLIEI
ncbi:hypothetical protein KM043_012275 [Ampulex compressa]|nr:hypothetical protein KM043_012275 [Ampulex compressa]